MFACLAAAAALASAPMSLPALADSVRAQALTLAAEPDARLAQDRDGVEAFAQQALALSQALRAAGAAADLPCIFKGIGEDAAARAADLARPQPRQERALALAELKALLDDAATLSPQAGALAPAPDANDLLAK